MPKGIGVKRGEKVKKNDEINLYIRMSQILNPYYINFFHLISINLEAIYFFSCYFSVFWGYFLLFCTQMFQEKCFNY